MPFPKGICLIFFFQTNLNIGSLRKHPFLLALSRWECLARKSACDLATDVYLSGIRSEELIGQHCFSHCLQMIQFNLIGIIQLAVGSSVELVFSETCDISANFSKKTELSTHSLPQGFSVALPFSG